MMYGLYISAGGLQAQQARQTVMANNLANAQTAGFKRDLVTMQSRANAVDEDPRMARFRMPVMEDQGGGVFAINGGMDLSQSLLETTGNETDFALQGRGFFTVQGDQVGQKLLTRDGRFFKNSDGNLVMVNGGRPLLGADGQPVKINPALPVTVDGKGQISQGGSGNTQIGMVEVADSRQLVKLGGNVMAVKDPAAMAAVPVDTTVYQGKYETSGVDPMVEMVNMMEGQRAFEANAKMITMQDQELGQLNTIARVA